VKKPTAYIRFAIACPDDSVASIPFPGGGGSRVLQTSELR
jgi:hypothetical protein